MTRESITLPMLAVSSLLGLVLLLQAALVVLQLRAVPAAAPGVEVAPVASPPAATPAATPAPAAVVVVTPSAVTPSVVTPSVVTHAPEPTAVPSAVPPTREQVLALLPPRYREPLDAIGCAESGWRYNAVNHNANGSTDFSWAQINDEVWGEWADAHWPRWRTDPIHAAHVVAYILHSPYPDSWDSVLDAWVTWVKGGRTPEGVMQLVRLWNDGSVPARCGQ